MSDREVGGMDSLTPSVAGELAVRSTSLVKRGLHLLIAKLQNVEMLTLNSL